MNELIQSGGFRFPALIRLLRVALPLVASVGARGETVPAPQAAGGLVAVESRVSSLPLGTSWTEGASLGTEVDSMPVLTDDRVRRAVGPDDLPPLLDWGWLRLHPRVGYNGSYVHGLYRGVQGDSDGFVHRLEPQVSFTIRDQWKGSYDPRVVWYEAPALRDTINHAGTVSGQFDLGGIGLEVENASASIDSPMVETGVQARRVSNLTRVRSEMPLTSKIRASMEVTQNLRWMPDFSNVYSWSVQGGLHRGLGNWGEVGLFASGGFDRIEPGVDMASERLRASLSGRLNERLRYQISGGAELRQFLNSGRDSALSPLADGSLDWDVTSTTVISAHGQLQVSPAIQANRFNRFTLAELEVRQRLLGRFQLSLAGGYRWTDLERTTGSVGAAQSIDQQFLRLSLSTRVLGGRGSVGGYLHLNRSDASNDALSFSGHQVGVRLSYGF